MSTITLTVLPAGSVGLDKHPQRYVYKVASQIVCSSTTLIDGLSLIFASEHRIALWQVLVDIMN